MSKHNADIAVILGEIIGLLEIRGVNLFHICTYRNAARRAGKTRCIKYPFAAGIMFADTVPCKITIRPDNDFSGRVTVQRRANGCQSDCAQSESIYEEIFL